MTLATAPTGPAIGDLTELATSFRRSLRAQNKSPRTVQGYLEGVDLFAAFLRREGMPTVVAHIRREHVEAFIAEQLVQHKPSTAQTRYRSLQQLVRWLVDEGETRASPMVNNHFFGAARDRVSHSHLGLNRVRLPIATHIRGAVRASTSGRSSSASKTSRHGLENAGSASWRLRAYDRPAGLKASRHSVG